jgi:hypothetical protein
MSNLNFARTFGGLSSPEQGNNGATRERKPDAQTWLNVGYTVMTEEVIDGKTVEVPTFISLPSGIALDTMDAAKKRGNNADYNARIDAKNHLMRQVQEAAAQLQPGEEKIIGDLGGLQIQLRRVSNKPEETPVDENRYAVKLPF